MNSIPLHVMSPDLVTVSFDPPLGPRKTFDSRLVRLLDITVSLLAILLLAPVFIGVALAVRLTSRGPILFAHRRIGLGGATFPCLKFRTMVIDAEARLREILESDPAAREEWARDHKLRRDPRITPIGRFLRGSSLDELPQLLNVLRGEMSLVGPRPIVAGEIGRYGRYYGHYCQCRPGITGLWQVSGRNNVSYRRRVAMDVCYVSNRNLAFNMRIMLLTVPMVLLARGSY
jgi:exopolysaccharide production protein ExoY